MKVKIGSRVLFSLALFLVFSVTMLGVSSIVSATPSNWSEVTRFTGSGTEMYTTDYFTCDHVEWRIRWEYVDSEYTVFNVFTYPQGEDAIFIDAIIKMGSEDTSGASYIHDNKGTFYMKINVANTESYTIIVEQDLDSVPEFSSMLILPLFMAVTLLAIIIYRGKHFIPSKCEEQ